METKMQNQTQNSNLEGENKMKTEIDLNSAKRLAHGFFTKPRYRNQRVNLFIDLLTGEVEAVLPSEIPASDWDYLCTLVDPYIEWGQSEYASSEAELEQAFEIWLEQEFNSWLDSLLSAVEI